MYLVSQSVNQSISQSVSQSISQSVSQLFGHVEFRHLFNSFSWQQLRIITTLTAAGLLNYVTALLAPHGI